MTAAILLLLVVTLQRLAELAISRRNTARQLARGAREHSPGHYPFLVLLHAAWLAGLWLLGWDRPVQLWWLGLFAILQVMRVWVLITLGRRWTTRIIVQPGQPPVQSGPYRFLSHPNYLIVVGEIAVLPLVFSLPYYALAFSMLNAALLTVRIRAENRALQSQMPASDAHGCAGTASSR